MKIINVSDKPYEWTFDGGIYGPIAPGAIVDYPPEIAKHAIKRSIVLDEDGNPLGFKVESLEDVKQDPKRLRELAAYPCPFAITGECKAEAFKRIEDLREHMDSHWGAPAQIKPAAGKPAPVAHP